MLLKTSWKKRQASGFKSVYNVEAPNLIVQPLQAQTRTPVLPWRMYAPVRMRVKRKRIRWLLALMIVRWEKRKLRTNQSATR